MALNEPKEITLTDLNGKERRYLVGKIPYMAGGREISVDYISSAQKGNYKRNQELAAMMFGHVCAFSDDGEEIPLKTAALIDNHVPDIPTGLKIEMAVAEHNMGFSVAGKIRDFQQAWQRTTEQFGLKISTILQGLSRVPVSAPSQNSEPSTAQKTPS